MITYIRSLKRKHETLSQPKRAQPVVARDRLPRRESEAQVVEVDLPACRV